MIDKTQTPIEVIDKTPSEQPLTVHIGSTALGVLDVPRDPKTGIPDDAAVKRALVDAYPGYRQNLSLPEPQANPMLEAPDALQIGERASKTRKTLNQR